MKRGKFVSWPAPPLEWIGQLGPDHHFLVVPSGKFSSLESAKSGRAHP